MAYFTYPGALSVVSLRAFETPPHNNLLETPSMSLKSEDVKNIAHLARLEISEDSVEQYAADLSSILDLVDQMNQVDTEGVAPMAHPMDASQRLRIDEVTETNQREKFQSIAPDVEAGLYRVPKVIE
jgi:aspartyl-tRNA(Asn)/glutamyl-tRNA(Gln) amidotransferase subunit C